MSTNENTAMSRAAAYFEHGAEYSANATEYKFKAIASAACGLAIWRAAVQAKETNATQSEVFAIVQEKFASVGKDSKSYRARFMKAALGIARDLFKEQAALDAFASIQDLGEGMAFMRARIRDTLNGAGFKHTLQEMLRYYAPTKAEIAAQEYAAEHGITYEQAREALKAKAAEAREVEKAQAATPEAAEAALSAALNVAAERGAVTLLSARNTLETLLRQFDAEARAALLRHAQDVCAAIEAEAIAAAIEAEARAKAEAEAEAEAA